jgi:hypothetical protein
MAGHDAEKSVKVRGAIRRGVQDRGDLVEVTRT